MRLSKIGEFGLIKNIRTRCASYPPKILKGIGDDAAAIRNKAGIMLVTTDMLVEGIHFDLSYTTFYQLGCKSLAVNISDIFAMGGRPEFFLLSLALPEAYDSRDVSELYSGIMKIARKFGVTVIGGDTCASRGGLVINGTLIGKTERIISRAGARAGDAIFVTGNLGDSAMGLMLLKKLGREKSLFSGSQFTVHSSQLKLIRRHLMPEPKPLKETKKITSMIDVSDGLLIDLSHICEESKAGAVIYYDKIPLSNELKSTAEKVGVEPMEFALRGGEDYVLLFTAPPDIKTKAVRIGEIIKRGRFIVDKKGRKKPFRAEGYEHFR